MVLLFLVGVKALYKNVKPFRAVVDGAGDLLNGIEKEYLISENHLAIHLKQLKEFLDNGKKDKYVARVVGRLDNRYYLIEVHNRLYVIIDYFNQRTSRNYLGIFPKQFLSYKFMMLQIDQIDIKLSLIQNGYLFKKSINASSFISLSGSIVYCSFHLLLLIEAAHEKRLVTGTQDYHGRR